MIAAGALLCGSATYAQQTYQMDDGTPENSIGIGNGDIIWLNQFNITGGNNIILSISLVFGSPGGTGNANLMGLPFTVFLWNDPNNDGSPADAMVLASAMGTITSVGTNTFVTVAITPTMVLTNSFFVGAMMTQPASTFPAALDTTAPTFPNRSWVAGGAPGTGNPNNLPGNQLFGPIESFGATFAGNWLVRANAIPEPSTYALLVGGAALIGVIARRRKRN